MISFVMFTLSMIKQAGLASILFVVDIFFDNDRGDCVNRTSRPRTKSHLRLQIMCASFVKQKAKLVEGW
jgi:hypothetical protein